MDPFFCIHSSHARTVPMITRVKTILYRRYLVNLKEKLLGLNNNGYSDDLSLSPSMRLRGLSEEVEILVKDNVPLHFPTPCPQLH